MITNQNIFTNRDEMQPISALKHRSFGLIDRHMGSAILKLFHKCIIKDIFDNYKKV